MRFTWDERKRVANLRKHGIDFAHAATIFRGFTLTAEDVRDSYGEQRFLTLGMVDRQVVSVTHTESTEAIRIISIRKATRHETNYYFSQIPD
ncbi:MAG: BrnT family toxin [Gammaproteobacteria bacterium]|nr:BrnT family toxin [Gammaproteobacteria bacterium]